MATIRALLDEAKSALMSGKADAALAPCRAVLEKYPKQLEATCLLAEACRELRQLPEALDLFERVVSADPESLIGHWGLSTIFEEQGQVEAALYELQVAWDLSPGHPAIREELARLSGVAPALRQAGLARVYWRGHQYRRAIVEARACLAVSPERLDVAVLLAEALWRIGRRDEAADLCLELLAESPDCLKAGLIRGFALRDGRKQLARALQLDPESRAAAALYPEGPLATRDVDLDDAPVTLPLPELPAMPPARVSMLVAAELIQPPASVPAAMQIAFADVSSDATGAGAGPPMTATQPAKRLVGEPGTSQSAAARPSNDADAPEAAGPLAGEEVRGERPLPVEPPIESEQPVDAGQQVEEQSQPPVPDWLAANPRSESAETVAAAGLDPALYAEWADLLAEEVDLDPAAAARLEAALAEATGSGSGSGPWREIVLDGISLTPPAAEVEHEPAPQLEPASTPEEELAAVLERASDADSLAEAFRDMLRARPDVAAVAALELRGLVEATPDHAGLRRALGDAYMRCGRFQKAIEEYNRAVALQPSAAVA